MIIILEYVSFMVVCSCWEQEKTTMKLQAAVLFIPKQVCIELKVTMIFLLGWGRGVVSGVLKTP